MIALDELYRYTYERVVDMTARTGAGPQHPHFDYRLSGAGDLSLTDVRNADALLLLRTEDAGQIAVYRLPDKAQLAEFHKGPDREMAIAVPPGRYLVRRRHDDATYEATFGLREGGQFQLADWGQPVIEFGVPRGTDPRITELVADSRTYEERLNLGSSPVVAGAASVVIPGAGQLYNGQIPKGIAYFVVTGSLLTGVIFNPTEDELGNGFWPALGAGIWGASIADGIYNVHRREAARPELGATVSWTGAFGGDRWPTHLGVSADVMLRRGVSIGLDRLGYTPGPDGSWDLQAGSRLMVASEGERWRPYLLLAVGLRHGRAPMDEATLWTRAVLSGGAGLRYYVVPRYFLEIDGRWEQAGDFSGFTSGVGMGVHLSR